MGRPLDRGAGQQFRAGHAFLEVQGSADPETEGGQSCAKVWTLGDPWKCRSRKVGPWRTPDRDPLAKPESRAPTSVSPLLPGWDQAGPQGPSWHRQLQGPCWPLNQPGLLCVWGDAPSPLQAWTPGRRHCACGPLRGYGWLSLASGLPREGLHHLNMDLFFFLVGGKHGS